MHHSVILAEESGRVPIRKSAHSVSLALPLFSLECDIDAAVLSGYVNPKIDLQTSLAFFL